MLIINPIEKNLPRNDSSSDSSAFIFPEINVTPHDYSFFGANPS